MIPTEQNDKLRIKCLQLAKALLKAGEEEDMFLVAQLVKRGINDKGDAIWGCRQAYGWLMKNGCSERDAWSMSGLDSAVEQGV
jgi:hypothetical protein